MKRSYFIIGLLGITLWSCKSRESASELAETSESTESEVDAILSGLDVDHTTNQEYPCTGEPEDSLIIRIHRSPCFGQCPIYEAKIYCSGYVLYAGENYVNRLGQYEANMTAEAIASILEYADSIGYFQLKDEYDGQVTDLATTTTMIHVDGTKKTIRNRYRSPQKLDDFEDFIDEKLEDLDWSKVAADH